ncbi:MAG: hypothetical protein IKG21_00430 [Atopobiaceae bacterium]|nr:hypothetical protein [Atopobiaceae bacterium]
MATNAATTHTTNFNTTPIKASTGTTATDIELTDEQLAQIAGGNYDPSYDPSGSCLTPDTHILLADGSAKRVDELLDDDELLVWDFDAGDVSSAPITFFHRVLGEAPVLRVTFSDGTSVGIVEEHVFFDLTAREFVAINSTDQEAALAGHGFAKLANGRIEEVRLESIRMDGTTNSYYSPVSEAHFNCFAEGMLSMSGFLKGFYNVFDLEENELRYDAAKKAADIAAVGEIPYAVFAGCGSRVLFERNNFGWFSVSLAKGLTTLPEALLLLDFFRPFFVGEGTGFAAA